MPDPQVAVAHHADHRMAAAAAAKAKRLWPDVIGEVLADEVIALMDLPLWMGSQTRTQRLIEAILSVPEGTGNPAAPERGPGLDPDRAARNPGAGRAA